MFPAQSAFSGPVVVGANVELIAPTTFNPAVVNINVGEKVVWTYNDVSGVPHTVTSGGCPAGVCTPSGVFDSGFANLLDTPGETFEHTFNTAGTFDYHCQVHGAEHQGTVVVAAAPPPPPPPQPPVVGGEHLPIENTALLLAGLQSSAIWMLPVLAGAAGVGAYYIKTRMNKE